MLVWDKKKENSRLSFVILKVCFLLKFLIINWFIYFDYIFILFCFLYLWYIVVFNLFLGFNWVGLMGCGMRD